MPRTRELQYGRVRHWQDRMSEKTRLADGSELDMLDPESIRRYVRKTLATNVEPSPQSLQRLKMLLEVADSLPQAKPTESTALRLVDAQAASDELKRRMAERGGGK